MGYKKYLNMVMRRLNTIIFNVEKSTISKEQIVDSLKRLIREYNEDLGYDLKGGNK